MKLVSLTNLLKYTFRQEGLHEKKHKDLLEILAKHNDQPYCEYLKRGHKLSSCEKPVPKVKKETKRPTAGHPIVADKGKAVKCKDHGIFTKFCAAGADATCNG